MVAFRPHGLAIAAIAMSLSSSALACLQIYGVVGYAYSTESGTIGNITTVDNGVQTCQGDLYDGTDHYIGGMFLCYAMNSIS